MLKIPRVIGDHDASIVAIECPRFVSWSFKREIWLYDKTDCVKFSEKLDQIDWDSLLSNLEDVDSMCEVFTATFLRVARECIPTKSLTIRNNDKPWFNCQLRKEIRIRERIRKQVQKFNRESDITKYKNKEIKLTI